MESQQNICADCNKVNLLSAAICINCSNTLTPIHDNDNIIEQFTMITNSDRENAIQLLGISNSINDAVALFFDTNIPIDSENSEEVNNDDSNNAIDQLISILTNTNESIANNRENIINLYNILSSNGDDTNETTYEYPTNPKEFAIQMLYGWGINRPHHCTRCSSRAFIKYIQVKNIERTQIIRLIPSRILIELNLDTTEKRQKCSEDILNNIDELFEKVCEFLSNSFDIIYVNYNNFKASSSNLNSENISTNFLELLQRETSLNYRTIWQALHQQDIENTIPQEERLIKLTELSNSDTFIQYVTNEWNSPKHTTPVTKETIECLRCENLDSTDKLKQLGLENENCAICFDTFKADNTEITMLGCHSFCKECILPWFKENDTCPICRKKIDYTENKNLKSE